MDVSGSDDDGTSSVSRNLDVRSGRNRSDDSEAKNKGRASSSHPPRASPQRFVCIVSGLDREFLHRLRSPRQAGRYLSDLVGIVPIETSISGQGKLWVRLNSQSHLDRVLAVDFPQGVSVRAGRHTSEVRRFVMLRGLDFRCTRDDVLELLADADLCADQVEFISIRKRFIGVAKVRFSSPSDRVKALKLGLVRDRFTQRVIRIEDYVTGSKHIQCFRCFAYGHFSRSCSERMRCRQCGAQDHKAAECEASLHCSNCESDGHSARSSLCPRLVRERLEHAKFIRSKRAPRASRLSRGLQRGPQDARRPDDSSSVIPPASVPVGPMQSFSAVVSGAQREPATPRNSEVVELRRLVQQLTALVQSLQAKFQSVTSSLTQLRADVRRVEDPFVDSVPVPMDTSTAPPVAKPSAAGSRSDNSIAPPTMRILLRPAAAVIPPSPSSSRARDHTPRRVSPRLSSSSSGKPKRSRSPSSSKTVAPKRKRPVGRPRKYHLLPRAAPTPSSSSSRTLLSPSPPDGQH